MQVEYRHRSAKPFWIPYYDTTTAQDQRLRDLAAANEYAGYEISLGRPKDKPSGYWKSKYVKLNTVCADLWLKTVFPYHCLWLDISRINQALSLMYACGVNKHDYAVAYSDHSTAAFTRLDHDTAWRIRSLICTNEDIQVQVKLTASDTDWLNCLY